MATTRNYKTSKGTELPLLNLRGKEYLEVKYRLVWFREEHPDWSIETQLMNVTDVSAYARATIRDEKGRTIATSHKFESVQGFPDERRSSSAQSEPSARDAEPSSSEEEAETPTRDVVEPGDYRITFGRKYKGKKLREIPKAEMESYIKWLEDSGVRPGTALAHQLQFLKKAFERLYTKSEGASSSH
ncbi:MAG: hypothetical protein ACK5Y2_00405 [Bdellovibrionales bacterium]